MTRRALLALVLVAAAPAAAVSQGALVARATLIRAATEAATKDQALALVAQARGQAEAAFAANPRDAAAQLQRAIAIGYTAKLTRSPSLAKEARRAIEAARDADPASAEGWAAWGGWHGDAIADVGATLAGMMLGAKRAEVARGFDAAMAKDPASPVYPTYYAILLLRTDKANAPRAAYLLAKAAALPARDGFEAAMRARAQQLLVPLRAGDPRAARALATRLQPFGEALGG